MNTPDPAADESIRRALVTLGESVLAMAGDLAKIATVLERVDKLLTTIELEQREGRPWLSTIEREQREGRP